MNATRLLTFLILLAACLAGFGSIQPQLLGLLGETWELPEGQELERTAVALDRQNAIVSQRIYAKLEVIQRLVQGDLTLFEAAAWFLALDEEGADITGPVRCPWPGETPQEKACYQVIHWVKQDYAIRDQADKVSPLAPELERQLREHLEQFGQVQLPAPPLPGGHAAGIGH